MAFIIAILTFILLFDGELPAVAPAYLITLTAAIWYFSFDKPSGKKISIHDLVE